MTFHILGSIRLEARGHTVVVGATKVRGMLGVLLLKVNKLISTETLGDCLWDDENKPPDVGKTMQTYASRLRRALRNAGRPGILITESGGYRLEANPADIDYHRFLGLVSQGHAAMARSAHDEAATAFAGAVDLWQRPPLIDLKTSWARQLRDTLEIGELLPAHSALLDAKLHLGDHDFVLGKVHSLLAEHDTDERLTGLGMRALAGAGRATEIPAYFRAFTGRLAAKLGTDPGPEVTDLCRQLTRAATGTGTPVVNARHTLPRDTPYFTGQAEPLGRLDALLTGPTKPVVIALDGPAGAGKTALVTHWATREASQFPDGVLFINLRGYAFGPPLDLVAALATLLTAAGAAQQDIPPGIQERGTLLRYMLTDRRSLIILDNARDSDHVRPLLAAVDCCPVLITSRRQLSGLTLSDGAEKLTVPPLPAHEAAALLVKRIGGRAGSAPATVHDLARLCANLPLALRIAGEHIAARPDAPIEDLAEEFRDTHHLLDAGVHGDDHGSTIRSMLSWSIEALPAEAAHLFHSLGLHPGVRFSTELAVVASGLPRAAVDSALDTLIGAHLIQQDQRARYHLHDLIQRYAADQVVPAETRAELTRRMIDWYLRSARNARRLTTPDNHDIPDVAAPTSVTPLAFNSADHARQWSVTEMGNLISCAKVADRHGWHDHVWRFAGCLNDLLVQDGDVNDHIDIQILGWKAAAEAGEREAEAGSLNNLGMAFIGIHDDHKAEEFLHMALTIFEEVGDRYGEGVCRHNIGTTWLNRDATDQALEWYLSGLSILTETKNDWAIAHVVHRLGDTYHKMGRHDEADQNYHLALALRRKIGHARGEGTTLTRMSRVLLNRHQVATSISYATAAMAIHRQTLDRRSEADTCSVLAAAYLHLASPAAISHANRAVALYAGLPDPQEQAGALELVSQIQRAAGEHEQAELTLDQSRHIMAVLGKAESESAARDLGRPSAGWSEIPTPRLNTMPTAPASSPKGGNIESSDAGTP